MVMLGWGTACVATVVAVALVAGGQDEPAPAKARVQAAAPTPFDSARFINEATGLLGSSTGRGAAAKGP